MFEQLNGDYTIYNYLNIYKNNNIEPKNRRNSFLTCIYTLQLNIDNEWQMVEKTMIAQDIFTVIVNRNSC